MELVSYKDEKFKTLVKDTMKRMDSGQVSAAEMIEIIEKVQSQAEEN